MQKTESNISIELMANILGADFLKQRLRKVVPKNQPQKSHLDKAQTNP